MIDLSMVYRISVMAYLRERNKMLYMDAAFLVFVLWVVVNAVVKHSVFNFVPQYKVAICVTAYLAGRFCKGSIKQCMFPLLAIPGIIQGCVVLLQKFGVLNRHSFYFDVSGTYGNPAPAAALISLSCVILMGITHNYTGKYRKVCKCFSGLTILVLIPSLWFCHTRSCVLALLSALCYFAILRFPRRKTRIAVFLGFVLTVVGSYFIRTGSANVRLLIWRASFYIFDDFPLSGSGLSSFASKYMFAQAEYFRLHPTSCLVEWATNHFQAYNELVLLLCEQGIIGAVLLIFPLYVVLRNSDRYRPVLIAVIVMSMFLYVSDIMMVYAVFWVVVGLSVGENDDGDGKRRLNHVAVGLSSLVLGLLMISLHLKTSVHNMEFDPNYKIPTYEKICLEADRKLADCDYDGAEELYDLAQGMIPCRIMAPFGKFRVYEKTDKDAAIRQAEYILNEHYVKIVSGRVLQIKQNLKNYLKNQ